MEEAAEFIQALSKYRRVVLGIGQDTDLTEAAVIAGLEEEVANLELMIEQVIHFAHLDLENIDRIKDVKIIRTEQRIDDEALPFN